MDETTNIAYFRHIQHKNQCVFTFYLKENNEQTENIQIAEEINAVRGLDDNAGSLLQHIRNKIQNVIKTRLNLEKYEAKHIEIFLINADTKKFIKKERILRSLIADQNRPVMQFQIFDQKFDVIVNAPLVKELQLPPVFYAGFSIQPRKCYCIYYNHKESKFRWYKSKDKINWKKVGFDFRYDISLEDVGHYLKFVVFPCKNGVQGPPAEIISNDIVETMDDLPVCPFEQRHEFTKTKLSGSEFRVVSYNVLSSRYAELNDQYNYCPPKALAIDYRKQLIGQEILGYQADIVCLQEVDLTAFMNYYKPLFQENGYACFYHKKGDRIPEGLACIYNRSRFRKIDDHQLVYCSVIKERSEFYYLWKMLKCNEKVKEYFLQQPTSLHVTVLKEKDHLHPKITNILLIANTHLFYHPDAEHIRLLQINMATTYLNFMRKLYSPEGKVHVIFCGDFNCSPNSNVFQYMMNGKLDNKLEVLKRISDKANLFHKFKFESACGIPKYTNYTKDFKACLDYIFIERNNLNVLSVAPFPKEEDLEIFEGLPNTLYPSDHLALIVDLKYV